MYVCMITVIFSDIYSLMTATLRSRNT